MFTKPTDLFKSSLGFQSFFCYVFVAFEKKTSSYVRSDLSFSKRPQTCQSHERSTKILVGMADGDPYCSMHARE